MPQIDIKTIQVFHRDNYPVAVGMIVSPESPQDTITAIIEPSFTDVENKADDFFNLKPRRFTFTVRTADTSFFDAPGSFMTAHPNFPNLTNYLLRAFDSNDAQVFEGIISIDSSYSSDTQTVEVTVYDPIVLFSDAKSLRLSTQNLQDNYTDPHDFQNRILTYCLDYYFIGNAIERKPTWNTDWTLMDWSLASYQNVYEFQHIAQFYQDIVGDYLDSAKNYFAGLGGSLTHVYDFSKFEIFKSKQYAFSGNVALFSFIGLIVFRDAVNDKNYIVGGHETAYSNDIITAPESSKRGAISTNNLNNPMVFKGTDTDYGKFCDYFRTDFTKWFQYVPAGAIGTVPIYFYPSYYPILQYYAIPLSALNDINTDLMHPIIKTITEMREYPMWMNTTDGSDFREDVRKNHMATVDQIAYQCVLNSDLQGFGVDVDRACLYRDQFALSDESGSLIECEFETATNPNTLLKDARSQSKAWLFSENDKSAYYGLTNDGDGVTNEIKKDTIDFEDGIFDLAYITNPMDEEENIWNISNPNTFHINYTDYPLTSTSFPLGTNPQTYAPFEMKGNVGRIIDAIPVDITVSGLTSETDYLFDTQSDNLTYFTVAELLQFFLASMNLYCYYTGMTFTFVRSFLSSVGTPIVIASADIIDWETQTQEYSEIDTESVLKPTLNYVPNALDTYYNEYAALDNKKATCKISRLFADPAYSISINSILSISSVNWRVERIKTYIGYYDVVLTKYITDPV